MTPEQVRSRGDRVRQVMEGEDFAAACIEVEEELTRMLMTTDPDEAERRESLYHEVQGLKAVIQRMTHWVDDGEFAKEELEAKDNAI